MFYVVTIPIICFLRCICDSIYCCFDAYRCNTVFIFMQVRKCLGLINIIIKFFVTLSDSIYTAYNVVYDIRTFL